MSDCPGIYCISLQPISHIACCYGAQLFLRGYCWTLPIHCVGLVVSVFFYVEPDSRVHGANMGPIWDRQDPGGPHVGFMNLAIWGVFPMKYICGFVLLCYMLYRWLGDYSVCESTSAPKLLPMLITLWLMSRQKFLYTNIQKPAKMLLLADVDEYSKCLVQDFSNSSVSAMELLQSCAKPSIFAEWKLFTHNFMFTSLALPQYPWSNHKEYR